MKRNKIMEDQVLAAVKSSLFEIDTEGRLWRLGKRGWDRWNKTVRVNKCQRIRAENKTSLGYLQVRVMVKGIRANASAHRVVWRHFKGDIPLGMTINHKNGQKDDNRPENLELATYAEQIHHAKNVLGHKLWMEDQDGEKNHQSKLTKEAVREILTLRDQILTEMKTRHGKKISRLAKKYNVTYSCVLRIIKGKGWQSVSL